jgi:SsrA-binding protein
MIFWRHVASSEELMGEKKDQIKLICKNKKAHFNYRIEDTYEAGIMLTGTEVKSCRQGQANLTDSYGRVKNGEIFLHDVRISPYSHAGYSQHDPLRVRKLLLHKQEIKRLVGKTREQGYAFIPLKMYFRNGKVKVEMGLARGKKLYDKREDIKKKDMRREAASALRGKNR